MTAGDFASTSGGTGFSLSFDLANGTYGKGGGVTNACYAVSGGGSGGYKSGYTSVTAGASYTITVGSGGTGNRADSGKSGFVLIAYGGDI